MLNNFTLKIANKIVGHSKTELETDPFARHFLRETQKIKVFQSHNVLPMLFVQGAIYIFFLRNDVPFFNLVFWVFIVTFAGLFRTFICKKIEKKINFSNSQKLYINELWLFFTSVNNNFSVGLGFWMVAMDGTERAVFAITLLNCIYAIGTTINASAKFNNFPVLIIINLGQGVLFLSGLGRNPDPVVSAGLIAICILLIQFGKRNSEILSESIRIRDEIRKQNFKLEKDKRIIERALATAKQANEDKSEFLAAVSHDLRQPLYAMTLFLACLRQTDMPKKSIDIVDKIEETSGALNDQFNSLLDISKFDAGVIDTNFTKIQFDTFLQSIVDGVREEAKIKNLELILETDPVSVITDPLLSERLIRNIILNAIHYTDWGTILVFTKMVPNGLHLIISDSGPGIAKEDQEKIFDNFYQTENDSGSKSQGSGLGLAIVKRISELLSLDLKLNSNLGEGTTFDIFFPKKKEKIEQLEDVRKSEEEVDTDTDTDTDYTFENINIMIVDDEPNILEALSRLIKTWKCTPYKASSLAEAQKIVDTHLIDFAIIDDMLGREESGLDLAELLSKKIGNQPIIVTGNVLPQRLKEIQSRGYKVYQKPVDSKYLRKEIAKALTNLH